MYEYILTRQHSHRAKQMAYGIRDLEQGKVRHAANVDIDYKRGVGMPTSFGCLIKQRKNYNMTINGSTCTVVELLLL